MFIERPGINPRLASILPVAAIIVTGSLLAFFRVPGLSARTVWAEDGALFLEEYLAQGPGLLNPYDGYLHLLPRMVVAAVVPVFGLAAYPLAVTAACSLILGLVAALTFYCASAITDNLAARLCWASIPILVAPGALESMGNAANLHWYLLWLTPWVLMKPVRSVGGRLLLGACALVIGLSEIQAAFFLPLIFFRVRDAGLWAAKAGLVAGAASQFLTLWLFPRGPRYSETNADVLSVVYGWFLNSSSAVVYGSSAAIIDHVQEFGAAPILVSALPFALVAVLAGVLGEGTRRLAGLVWLLSSFVFWTAAVVLNPAPNFAYSGYRSAEDWATFVLSRYSTVPSVFLLALVPLLYAGNKGGSGPSARWPPWAADPRFRGAALGAFLVLQSVYYFPFDAVGSTGPEWSPQIEAAQLACRAETAPESVRIHQAPAGWVTEIRCSDL